MTLARIVLAVVLFLRLATSIHAGEAPEWRKIERGLDILRPGEGVSRRLDLSQALAALKIHSVSVALIDGGKLAWAHAWGEASPQTLYQAASLSKLVTAVAALRLAEEGRLSLDRNVNDDLTIWRAPENDLTAHHPVTLRRLLSMTAGINVPGYLGYEPGAPLPKLAQILNGEPPANSPAVRVIDAPGSRYAYSGGGYEVVRALIEAKSDKPFDETLRELVFRPVKMTHSFFLQPLSAALAPRAALGHYADGRALAGGWRVIPELAAGGLWSTPSDLAKLLIEIAHAYRGERTSLMRRKTALEMLTKQNGGPYGLGGAVDGAGRSLVLMKRGQNIGYQSYMLIFPATAQGMVVMTDSDNGTTLATALIRRAGDVYHWPRLESLED
jgi:CubicO group peptidase (beta-lactamase class C family)